MSNNYSRSRKTAQSTNGGIVLMSRRIRNDLDALQAKLRFCGYEEAAEDTKWSAIFLERVVNAFRKKP